MRIPNMILTNWTGSENNNSVVVTLFWHLEFGCWIDSSVCNFVCKELLLIWYNLVKDQSKSRLFGLSVLDGCLRSVLNFVMCISLIIMLTEVNDESVQDVVSRIRKYSWNFSSSSWMASSRKFLVQQKNSIKATTTCRNKVSKYNHQSSIFLI